MADGEDDYREIKAELRPRRPGESMSFKEVVLRRRDRNLKQIAERAKKVKELKRERLNYKRGNDLKIKRPEEFILEYRRSIADYYRLKRVRKKNPRKQKGKVIVAVRNGKIGGHRRTRALLGEMGLKDCHCLTFIKNTPYNYTQLKLLEPFVWWGAPQFKTVFNIVHKKAAIADPEDPSKKILLKDNAVIEKHFGDEGVLCTEDFADEIYKGGKAFEKISESLQPILLGNVQSIKMLWNTHYQTGDMQEEIDEKVAQLM